MASAQGCISVTRQLGLTKLGWAREPTRPRNGPEREHGACSDEDDEACGACNATPAGNHCACRCANAATQRVHAIPGWLRVGAAVDYYDRRTWRSAAVCEVHTDDPTNVYITLRVGNRELQTTLDRLRAPSGREAPKAFGFTVACGQPSLVDVAMADVATTDIARLMNERCLSHRSGAQHLAAE